MTVVRSEMSGFAIDFNWEIKWLRAEVKSDDCFGIDEEFDLDPEVIWA